MEANYCLLPGRGVLRLSGADVLPFLQALITRDLDSLTPARAVYGALLTPQGKYLFDFFLARRGDVLLLEGEAARLEALAKRLNMYRLRADVKIEDVRAEWEVLAAFGAGTEAALGLTGGAGAAMAYGDGVAFLDPRLPEAGARIIAPTGQAGAMLAAAGCKPVAAADYDYFRLCLGLPDSGRDLVVDKSLMLESNLERLHGVDFDKGCFVGQELTARTKYRALVRKRLLPVRIDGPLPDPGTPLLAGEREVAVMRSGQGDRGLALVRVDRMAEAGGLGRNLTAGAATLTLEMPDWADFELPELKA
ncbi:MAG: folate-binding protein [Alphaproteobacteria bacterium]|nr:folate-binding protein [Alphaproteobacteria bacterium]